MSAATKSLTSLTPACQGDISKFVVPIELVDHRTFTAIALMFVGLGQAMGRSFEAATDRVTAYSVNVVGSLAGIGAFGLVSYLQIGPVVWFAIGLAATLLAKANIAMASVRIARPDGSTGGRRDQGRRTFPHLLVALLQGHLPPP